MESSGDKREITRKNVIDLAKTFPMLVVYGCTGSGEESINPITDKKVRNETVSVEEKLARLKAAGLGEWVELYQANSAIEEMTGGYRLFEQIQTELDSVAIGEKKSAPLFSEGWQVEAKDRAELLAVASLKAGSDEIITDGGNVELAKQILVNLGEVFPVMTMFSQNQLKIDVTNKNGRHTDPKKGFIELGNDLFTQPTADEAVYTILHEKSHRYDNNHFDINLLNELKRVVPKQDVVRYLEAYTKAVYESVCRWSELPFDQALKLKHGLLIDLPEMFDMRNDQDKKLEMIQKYMGITEDLEQVLAMDDEELRRRINIGGRYLKNNSEASTLMLSPEESLLVKYNVLAHECMRRAVEGKRSSGGVWVISGSELMTQTRAEVVAKIAHFMVGPIYGGGWKIYGDWDPVEPWSKEMSPLIAQAAILEEARIRLYSPDSEIISLEQFRHAVYDNLPLSEPEEVVVQNIVVEQEKHEIVPSEEEWDETIGLRMFGIKQVAGFNGTKKEYEDYSEVCQYRIFELPDRPDQVDKQYYLVGVKRWTDIGPAIPMMECGWVAMPKEDDGWKFEPKTDDKKDILNEGEAMIIMEERNVRLKHAISGGDVETLIPIDSRYLAVSSYYGVKEMGVIRPKASFLRFDKDGNPEIVKRDSLIYPVYPNRSNLVLPIDYSQQLKNEVTESEPLAEIKAGSLRIIKAGDDLYSETAEDGGLWYGSRIMDKPQKTEGEKSKIKFGVEIPGRRFVLFDIEGDITAEKFELLDWENADNTPSIEVQRNLQRGRELIVIMNQYNGRENISIQFQSDISAVYPWPEGEQIMRSEGVG